MVYQKYDASFKYVVVKAAIEGKSLAEINAMHAASVSLDSLRRWSTLYKQTKAVVCDPSTYLQRGRRLSLDESERTFIRDLVKNQPTIYMAEIQQSLAEDCNVNISLSTIANELHLRLNHSRKCIRKVNPRQDDDERAAYVCLIAHYDPEMLVFTGESLLFLYHSMAFFTDIKPFPDERGICLDGIARTKGWAPVGERTPHVVRDRATHRFNIIPAVALSGLVAVMVQQENVIRFDFEFFLEHILVHHFFSSCAFLFLFP